MTSQELSSLSNLQLLDVRLSEDFAATHLEGAVNNCVFEVSFAEKLADTAPDPTFTTVVYGANEGSHEAAAAQDKLQRLGYADVRILSGGIEQAIADGAPLVQGKPLELPPSLSDGVQSVDPEQSQVEWLGRNLVNKHWGTAPIMEGELNFANGQLTGGKVTLDMTRLACTDLAESDLHDVLIGHLESDDFFDIENFPTAEIMIKQATQISDSSPGSQNLRVHADLSLRGETHPIEFEASAGITPEGKAAAQASFSIDRTRWGVLYGSGKFFHRLAGHLVNDEIEFQIKLITS